jgi:hypothetical protein
MASDEKNQMSTAESDQSATVVGEHAAAESLRGGARGALVVSAIAVGLLFIGWLAFYFLIFMPRGPVG